MSGRHNILHVLKQNKQAKPKPANKQKKNHHCVLLLYNNCLRVLSPTFISNLECC